MPRKQTISKTGTKDDLQKGQTKRMKEMLLEELAKYPIVQIACQRTGVGRSTFYKWKNRDKKFAARANEAVVEGKKFTNDMAESQLIKSVGNGHMTGIIFWLKNNHPDYTDKVRYEHHHTHEVELTEKESAEIGRALTNIGLANILKRDGFTYTKEELAEAERTIAVYRVRKKEFEKEEEYMRRRSEALYGVGAGGAVKTKEEDKLAENELEDKQEEEFKPPDPNKPKSEIIREFQEWQRNKEKGK